VDAVMLEESSRGVSCEGCAEFQRALLLLLVTELLKRVDYAVSAIVFVAVRRKLKDLSQFTVLRKEKGCMAESMGRILASGQVWKQTRRWGKKRDDGFFFRRRCSLTTHHAALYTTLPPHRNYQPYTLRAVFILS
jgi:hypothetical protein